VANDLPRVLAAPIEEVIDGKTYRFSIITANDAAELTRWIQSKHREVVSQRRTERAAFLRSSLKEAVVAPSPYDFGRLLLDIAAQAETFTLEDAAQLPEANSRLLWLSLRRNHPAMTEDECAGLFGGLPASEIERIAQRVIRDKDDFEAVLLEGVRDARRLMVEGQPELAMERLNKALGEPEYYICDRCDKKVAPELRPARSVCECGGLFMRPPVAGMTG